MLGQQSDRDRIADLERQVAELQARLALADQPLPAGGARQPNGMCASCAATLARGGSPVCGCTLFGPQIMCAVA